jgi:hypothetical protein
MRAALLGTIPGPTYYAALSVGDPGDAGATLVEPVIGVNGYSRKPVEWDPAVSTPISGSPAILYCWFTLIWTSTGPWTVSLTQPVSHVAIFTAAAGTDESTFVGSVPLLPPRLMDRAGIQLRIPAYDLQLSIGLED